MPSTTITSSGFILTRTILYQSRVATVRNGVPGFAVTTYVSVRGQLPDPHAFVMQVRDPADSSQDVFVRVVAVSDLDSYQSDRSLAVMNGVDFYRTSSVSQFYTDITTAKLAADNLRNEVDGLVQDWVTYNYYFTSGPPGDSYPLPSSDKTVLAGLIEAWQNAVSSTALRLASMNLAEQNETSTLSTLNSARDHYDAVKADYTLVTNLADQSDALSTVRNSLQSTNTTIGSQPIVLGDDVNAGDGLWLVINNLIWSIDHQVGVLMTSGADPSTYGAFKSARDTFATNAVPLLSTIQSYVRDVALPATGSYIDVSGDVALAASRLDAVGIERTRAQDNYDGAVIASSNAQRDYNAALAVENRALAVVRESYPSFDPNNPTAALT